MSERAEVVFVPADPPRLGTMAFWGEGGHRPDGRVEIVVPSGDRVRRRRAPAKVVPVTAAIECLRVPPSAEASRSFAAWSTATLTGLGLIARGRLRPAWDRQGNGSWRVGPLDRDETAWLGELAAAMPPSGHAIPLPDTRPLQVPAAAELIRAYWDALADALVRTAAAPLIAPAPPYSDTEPRTVRGPTDWLDDLVHAERMGAQLVLRIEPPAAAELPETQESPEYPATPTSDETPAPFPDAQERPAEAFCAVLQLRSTADPSLLVDVADLWQAPDAVVSRLGADAETDLMLALRRGARAWPPLGSALQAAAPTALKLTDDALESLLSDGASALDDAGVEVLWPTDLDGGGLTVRASVSTPTPVGGAEQTFTLSELLRFRWQPMLDGEPLSESEIAALAAAKRPVVRLRGRWVRIDPTQLERIRRRRERTLTAAEALGASITGELEVDGEPTPFGAEGALADLADVLTGQRQEPAEQDLPEPVGLRATLRPYQRRGLAWLAGLTKLGLGGCLADDMGLGKTLQLIAVHLHHRQQRRGPTLVICPTSLLGTWQRELERFAPDVPVRRFHGSQRNLDELATDEVVLTTYGVLRQDHARLAEPSWGLAVADEAQHAKNPLSRTARALREVPATARIALTGTPVENRLSELWSILDWVMPGILGSLERFRQRLAVPVERYHDPDATARLNRLTRPFLLRRRKTDPAVAPELPDKTESDVVVSLTAEQATLYQAVVDDALAKINASEGIERRGLVLSLLTSLKQVCNHPAHYLHESGPLARRSGKLAALEELLEVIVSEGESVLVFSQYVEMLELLAAHLHERGIRTLSLHGGIGSRRREQLVAEFQAGAAPVFLLSLKAGGIGLTLTQATHVVHFDRWWNPAVEDQATDRAYRIGQEHNVWVHRLVTEGTLEDRIAALIETKRGLAEAVVGSGEGWLTELSDDELADLVQLGAAE